MTTRATLLEGGLIVDGSGGPAWTGDLLLQGERIARLGEGLRGRLPAGLKIEDLRVLDCRGLVVAPGFIDAHTHDDAIVLHEPAMLPKLTQGVTTVVAGNCGISLAPYAAASAGPPLNLLGAGSFRYAGMGAYMQAVEAARPALNVVALAGHTTLRYATMSDLTRAATTDERARMAALLEEAMCCGAHGLSSGLFYAEAHAAPADEVTALARIAARHGGIYATHLRSEMAAIIEALHEAGDCAFEAGLPLVISHHKCAGPANWGRTSETLPLIDALAARQPVAMDVYPYLAGSTVLREDLVDGVIDVLVTWSDPHPEQAGRLLAAVAADWGVEQLAALRRLQPGGACYFQIDESDMERVLAHPRSMIGSDGLPHDRHPHPRLWGTFPRVFARYWRDKGLLTLEQAVHKMTGLTARTFRIAGRGLLQAGHMADVVVFDAARIADRATYDAPMQASVGVRAVFVNGECAYRQDGDGDTEGDTEGDSEGDTDGGNDAPRAPARAGRMLRRAAA